MSQPTIKVDTKAITKIAEKFMEDHEGLRLKPYKDSGGHWTVGVGHLIHNIHLWTTITDEEAMVLLDLDIQKALQAVLQYVKVPLTVNQAAALVSFVFNLGVTAFRKSTLLRRLNLGEYALVPKQLRRWVHDNGKVVPGLVNRREAEIVLWNTP